MDTSVKGKNETLGNFIEFSISRKSESKQSSLLHKKYSLIGIEKDGLYKFYLHTLSSDQAIAASTDLNSLHEFTGVSSIKSSDRTFVAFDRYERGQKINLARRPDLDLNDQGSCNHGCGGSTGSGRSGNGRSGWVTVRTDYYQDWVRLDNNGKWRHSHTVYEGYTIDKVYIENDDYPYYLSHPDLRRTSNSNGRGEQGLLNIERKTIKKITERNEEFDRIKDLTKNKCVNDIIKKLRQKDLKNLTVPSIGKLSVPTIYQRVF